MKMKSTAELNQDLAAAVANGEFYIVEITTDRCPTGKHKSKQADGTWVQIDQYANGQKMIFSNKFAAQKQAGLYFNAKVATYTGPLTIGMGPFGH
jgi:hypothetical protein